MTDREKYLTILDRFYRGRGASLLTKDESEALDYAISSIKTDLKYDLLYEETKHIADADKKIEPTPNDCETCIHNKGVLECDMYGCKYEPTTKNDLGVDCISRDEVCRYVAEFVNHEFSTREEEELIDNIITGIEHMPSVTPQEPFINKSCVSSEVCEHDKNKVLDKLRAEIVNINVWAMRYEPDEYLDQRPQIVQKVKEHVIEIIDRYKTETEDI